MRRIFGFVLVFCATAQTQDVIRSPRPLADAATRLQQRFHKRVTYEEFVRVWFGELAGVDGDLKKWTFFPKIEALSLPPANADLEQSVRQTVDAYNQSSNGTRFDILKSKFGLHIVPRRMHDERGKLVDTRSFLDVKVNVAAADRTPLQHLRALGDAITAAAGTKVDMSASPGNQKGFDNTYQLFSKQFHWGVRRMVARDALMDLLNRSTKTFSWRLYCQSSYKAADRMCAVNLEFVE